MDHINWPDNSNPQISAKLSRDGIEIRHAATSCHEGDYAPIFVQWMTVLLPAPIWGDINDADPTHIIDMSKALESNRKETA